MIARWAEDTGRTDMAVAALIGISAIAVQKGRPVLASLSVVIALAVHETGFFFGSSLLLALYIDYGRWRTVSLKAALTASAVVVAALALYASLPLLPHATPETMVEVVRAHLPRAELVDWAIYFAVSGSRGVRTSICQNLGDPNYFLHVLTGLLVIVLFIAILRRNRRPHLGALLVASIPPFLFLSVVANDIARWTVLGSFNVWVLCASNSSCRLPVSGDGLWMRLALAALVIALIHPYTYSVDTPLFSPTPVIERIVQDWGGPATPTFAAVLERCDPDWRSVLER